MSCSKAQEFLEAHGWTVAEEVDARKTPLGRDEALALARAAEQVVIVGRGDRLDIWYLEAGLLVKMRTVRLKKDGSRTSTGGDFPGGIPIDRDATQEKLLGPSKKLRAPTLRYGKTLVVGFSDAAYRQVLGA